MKRLKTIPNTPGRVFRDRDGKVAILLPPSLRESATSVSPEEVIPFPYLFPETHEHFIQNRITTALRAKDRLVEFKSGDPHAIGVGIEVEGILYDMSNNFLNIYKGDISYETLFPESFDAHFEVATGLVGQKAGDLRYPSSATEIAAALGETMRHGFAIANRRNGRLVFSSVAESGRSEDIRLTEHKKLERVYQLGLIGVHQKAPKEVRDFASKFGVTDIVPINGTHVHTSNPGIGNELFDPGAAYAMGILGVTQLSHVESFMLFNTTHLLGKATGKKDVRSYLRRTFIGAQDTTIPDNAFDLMRNAVSALANGEIHAFSREPRFGQHDRIRILKEHGTTESVAGAANPDMRLVLAHAYFQQLLRVLSYEAIAATNGDETQILTYLKATYPNVSYLFEQIPTMGSPESNFEQEKRFNVNGFVAGNNGKNYREQMTDIRKLVRTIGENYRAFKLQAEIVDHVFERVSQSTAKNISLAEYLDIGTGMKGGIVTDYKSSDIAENIKAQAEGTEKQITVLNQVGDDPQKLQAFFGMTGR